MIRRILFVTVAVLFIFGIGKISFAMDCHRGGSQHSEHQQLAQEHQHSEVELDTEAASQEPVNVENKICPVSGEKIGSGKMEVATYEYKGKIYNLCCPMCIEEFKKDPEKYIKKVEEELQSSSKEEIKKEPSSHEGMHEGPHHP